MSQFTRRTHQHRTPARRLLTAAVAAGVSGLLGSGASAAPDATIDIHVDQPTVAVTPSMYGIFFEEINRGGEGGIWSQLVLNSGFEDSADGPLGWEPVQDGGARGDVSLDKSRPLNGYNPRALKFQITEAGKGGGNDGTAGAGRVGMSNAGYKGLAVEKGAKYDLSIYLATDGTFAGPVTVSLEDASGKAIATTRITDLTKNWKQHKAVLTAERTDPAARLVVSAGAKGTFWVDMVLLYPQDTFKGHGFRKDLMQKLADLKPAFVRFPGGCWVEGDTMATSYRWKQTIGDPAERRTVDNLWRYTCNNGLGYHEYLQMTEDLGAQALYVFNCGMSHHGVVPVGEMDPWVQDALDAIEYAIGPKESKWGSLRAKAGHPEPFPMKYVEIGNENGGPAYNERYALFYNAIKEKYPQIEMIACDWNGRPTSAPIQILDEHYYNTPQFFMANAHKYDSYPRDGYKVYCGEYAVTQPKGRPSVIAAVGEAAFITGMERNADVVTMTSYAPLFNNVGYTVWSPNAINFDASRVFGTPSYYVQKMFSVNRPDHVLSASVDVTAPADADAKAAHGTIGLGTWLTQAEYKDVQVTKDQKTLYRSDFSNGMSGFNRMTGNWLSKSGAIRQSGNEEGAFAALSGNDFSNYTLTLKARKTGGSEGFLIRFNSTGDGNYMMWNLGGWSNTRHQLEVSTDGGKSPVGPGVNGQIETGRWYDIKLVVKADKVQGYLDGKLLLDTRYGSIDPIYMVAGRAGNDVVLKVVNVTQKPMQTLVRFLPGKGEDNRPGELTATAVTQTLSGPPAGENTLEEPTKYAPVDGKADVKNGQTTLDLPAHSVTVLRVPMK